MRYGYNLLYFITLKIKGGRVLKIDDYISNCQFSEFHNVHIDAPPEIVYQITCRLDLGQSFLIKMLFWLRAFTAEQGRLAAHLD
jgi:hypothetical protein